MIQIETVVIGGGQAGLAASYYLKQRGAEHVVLEAASAPGSAWRHGRWDSFTLVTPNRMLLLPGAEYEGDAPGAFLRRDEVVAYLEQYVENWQIPLRYGVRVLAVNREPERGTYLIETEADHYEAANVIVATGLYQEPRLPAFQRRIRKGIAQLHSSRYRNPQTLPPGAVLVVGSAQSGCQITENLYLNGRKVYLSVGGSGRGPRRYRGKDITEWLALLPERTVDQLPDPADRFQSSIHVSGVDGGRSLNLHKFARDGVRLLGRLEAAESGRIRLAPDLMENLARADAFEAELVKNVDTLIEQCGLDAPAEDLPQYREGFDSEVLGELDLDKAGITSIIWATGYRFDFSLVKLEVTDEYGFPLQKRGVTGFAGLYFLGLPWLHTAASGLLRGVGQDAKHIVDHLGSRDRQTVRTSKTETA